MNSSDQDLLATFLCWLIDNKEGETVYEESLSVWGMEFIAWKESQE